MDCFTPPAAPVATEALRCFVAFNESTQHGCEIDASSHEDAAARYRERFAVQGYARIKTSDAEVLLARREGPWHRTHYTYGPEGPVRMVGLPPFALPRN